MRPLRLAKQYPVYHGSRLMHAVPTRVPVHTSQLSPIHSFKLPLAGFTLIELLIAIVVLAVLITIAAPNFSSVIANNRATAAANELLSTLQFARSEAVKLNRDVTVCGGADCESASDNWANGWVVLRGNTLLRVRDPFPAGVEITGEPQELAFRPAGNVVLVEGTGLSFAIRANGGPGADRCLTLQATGRSSISPVACP